MTWSSLLFATALATAALAPLAAKAGDEATRSSIKTASGKAAAHAALGEAANVPLRPPRLPELDSTKAPRGPSDTPGVKHAESAGKARAEAQKHAADDSRAARIDSANRAADGSVAAAAGNANADAHAAAGQARAAAARANAAARKQGTPAGGHP